MPIGGYLPISTNSDDVLASLGFFPFVMKFLVLFELELASEN